VLVKRRLLASWQLPVSSLLSCNHFLLTDRAPSDIRLDDAMSDLIMNEGGGCKMSYCAKDGECDNADTLCFLFLVHMFSHTKD